MNHDVDAWTLSRVRGTDSNSLLRLYDEVHQTLKQSRSQHERKRAEKALERITTELRKRNISLWRKRRPRLREDVKGPPPPRRRAGQSRSLVNVVLVRPYLSMLGGWPVS
jgi:hypothetical protein